MSHAKVKKEEGKTLKQSQKHFLPKTCIHLNVTLGNKIASEHYYLLQLQMF